MSPDTGNTCRMRSAKADRQLRLSVRLWTLHPRYLDANGLVACWREALLARKVLAGNTKGYRHHPQLQRFRQTDDPVSATDAYLAGLLQEARRRSYRFDASKIEVPDSSTACIPATTGQLEFEKKHLLEKLAKRSPGFAILLEKTVSLQPHPLFAVKDGEIESWEKIPEKRPLQVSGSGDTRSASKNLRV